MDPLMSFSETNSYILSKLVALVRRETGDRYRLSSNASISQLLMVASQSSDERIQNHYNRFLENLPAEHLTAFKNAGVNIPNRFIQAAEQDIKLSNFA
ncbi:hypothetical protein [Reinekea thalattae]|uniref:Uncharacterized protein n=1 Tax=Reinekea thalattae TaxID=2593301 RepID=A0A5C8ZB96_9GAMM|nr:hypothetical protein [Reinekea thalattae]TXR54166.1 hypothetical protein FME95_06420 [Reinekea thalattae]